MQQNTQWIFLGIIVVGVLVLGMYAQNKYPVFSVVSSTRTCESWKANAGITATTVPFDWDYTSSQKRCVTQLLDVSTGCQITYTAGSCASNNITNPTCTPACTSTQTCVNGQCVNNACIPSCTNKQCGDNGCGGSCGTCTSSQTCTNNQCVTTPTTCTSGQKKCATSTQYQTCLSNGLWSGIQNCDQNYFCSNGVCVYQQPPGCNTIADTDCDNRVTRAELGSAISKWTGGTMSRNDLGLAIQAWVTG